MSVRNTLGPPPRSLPDEFTVRNELKSFGHHRGFFPDYDERNEVFASRLVHGVRTEASKVEALVLVACIRALHLWGV